MRQRWYYFKRMLQADRLFLVQMFGTFAAAIRHVGRWIIFAAIGIAFLYAGRGLFDHLVSVCGGTYAVRIVDDLVRGYLPAYKEDEGTAFVIAAKKKQENRWKEEEKEIFGIEEENAGFRDGRILAEIRERKEREAGDTADRMRKNERYDTESENKGQNEMKEESENKAQSGAEKQNKSGKLFGKENGWETSGIILEKLNDYDYLMKKFYNVHPTTTADRDLMQAGTFLAQDLSIEKTADVPQILIYHTHSQETYADHETNPDADVVHLGKYLTELLREKGYCVIHDESVYDYRNGKLDRSAAYTYALDGITGILQKYPSIEVVLDVHRDGVAEGTRLVTEIGGKEAARIMFFNGTSMSPDGPIEYLPNPNLSGNLAFSFQMQLLAEGKYPGLMRKIYLKGLRYNEHVRARSALIEVGAQTNTYAEAKAAMEPLADVLDLVLDPSTG